MIYQYFADEFSKVIRNTELFQRMPFDLDNSSFMKLYFGSDKKRQINYSEFAQFLHVKHIFYFYSYFANVSNQNLNSYFYLLERFVPFSFALIFFSDLTDERNIECIYVILDLFCLHIP